MQQNCIEILCLNNKQQTEDKIEWRMQAKKLE